MKKKIISTIIATAIVTGILSGCAGTQSQTNSPTDSGATENTSAEAADTTYKIGISQFAEHGSLDNCREGFIEGLKEAGIVEGENAEIIFENAQADTGTASTIADSLVSKQVDLICAIATPSAMSAYNSSMDAEIPVIYTAVSDPKSAGLANEDGTSTENISGTADELPVKEQLEMIRTLMPDAKKVGILYTTSEANSVSTIETYKALASEYDLEIVETGISTIADVETAVKDMVTKVDCISNLTDNTVVSALQTVLAAANEQGIPVFGSEVEQVKNGCMAAMGIDYVALGKQTGAMAAKVLKGESAAGDITYETCEGAKLYINKAAAKQLSFELDEEYTAQAAEAYEEITTN